MPPTPREYIGFPIGNIYKNLYMEIIKNRTHGPIICTSTVSKKNRNQKNSKYEGAVATYCPALLSTFPSVETRSPARVCIIGGYCGVVARSLAHVRAHSFDNVSSDFAMI